MKTKLRSLSIAAVCLLSFIFSYAFSINAYAYVPIDADITVDCLEIPDERDNTYAIKIESENESFPAPRSDKLEISENGKGCFKIDITEPGTYTYRIYELSGEEPEIEYDRNVYIVTVFAEHGDGDELTYSISVYSEGNDRKKDAIRFRNMVIAGDEPTTTTDPLSAASGMTVTVSNNDSAVNGAEVTAEISSTSAASTETESSTETSAVSALAENNSPSITEFIGSVLTGDSFPAHTVRMIMLFAFLTAVASFMFKKNRGKEDDNDE